MTFCTGGIRCVKVNAFLQQELGFTQTMRLQDGIHGYLRYLDQHPGQQSYWEGDNFVFDKRQTMEEEDKTS
jgi:predicted sulfurtransferase